VKSPLTTHHSSSSNRFDRNSIMAFSTLKFPHAIDDLTSVRDVLPRHQPTAMACLIEHVGIGRVEK
jgi:hypothetical protein